MREIKFRAWNPKLNEMFTGEEVALAYDIQEQMFNTYAFYHGEKVDEVLMQYTGLTDKNGVEIYEGDIIRCLDEFNGATVREGRVTFDRASYWVDYAAKYLTSDDILDEDIEYEVIGNIYENPELLR